MRANLRSGLAGVSPLAGFASKVTDLKLALGETKSVWLSIKSANISKTARPTLRTGLAGRPASLETMSTSSFKFIEITPPLAVDKGGN
jgi:hypothetical protein